MNRTRAAIVPLFTVALLVLTTVTYVPAASATTPSYPWTEIRHVVIVMMENHAYDNYFGTYCQTPSPVCLNTSDGIPPGTCVPKNDLNYSQGCVTPFNFTKKNLVTHDL